MSNENENITVKAYIGRATLRKASEPEYKADDWKNREAWVAAFPAAYPHVFATVLATPEKLFTEQNLCIKGPSGVLVMFQKYVRRDAKAPGRDDYYLEQEIDNWRASFIPEMLEGWDVEPAVLAAIEAGEPFVILDANNVRLEAPLTDEQVLEIGLQDTTVKYMVEMFLKGADVETVEELTEEQMEHVLKFARMAI